jgi:hypothetical protein
VRVYADVYGARLELLERPEYLVAHPNEQDDALNPGRCGMCALAVRPDTGELVLLWRCGGLNWSVSREDPHHERHHREITGVGRFGGDWEAAAIMRAICANVPQLVFAKSEKVA